jgi:fatty-acyl-CoA synthase
MDEIIPYRTLADALSLRRERDPQSPAFVFLSEDGQPLTVSNGRLHDEMKAIALGLRARGIGKGEVVLIACGHGYELVACFWGAVCCGAVPSILTYWHPGSDADAYARKVGRMAAAVRARAVITLPDLHSSMTAACADTGCLTFTVREVIEASTGMTETLPELDEEQIALLQFTSGTTSTPKAIRFSHRAVLDHVAAGAAAFRMTQDWVYVSWLPFYHDMGLIGHIRALLHGGMLVCMAPQTWLKKPVMLLLAIHRYRGTMTNMPNFSFDYCAQRIRDEDLAGVDLSSWRVLCNGSEQVRVASMQRFSERFAAYGFRSEALAVGYGMAENVMGISVTPPGGGINVDWVSTEALHTKNRAIPVEAGSADARPVAGCGYPYRGIDLAIVNEKYEHLPEREVGEIAVRSNTLFTGYYLDQEGAASVFRDGWFLTGDLGYCADGQLYVCGRKKDLIIVGGRNVDPHAIENIADGVFGHTAGRCAAFGLNDPDLGTEVPVLVIERRRDMDKAAEEQLIRRVRQLVLDELEINLSDVRMVPRGWVAKTTSGKIARAASRKKYLDERDDPAPGENRLSPDELTPVRVQQIVTHLFEIVLGTKGVGPDDDFIKLGGDSLSALRLFVEIERRFGRKVPAAEFFRQPTVRHLSMILCRCMNGEAAAETVTPPGLAGAERQLQPGIKPRLSFVRNSGSKKTNGLLGQKALDITYRFRLSFLAWMYGQRWVQRVVERDIVGPSRRFYALLEHPLQNVEEVIQCELVWESPGAIEKQLMEQVFIQKPGCWSLRLDMSSLERSYHKGKGVILAGRHSGLNKLVQKLTMERLKPGSFTVIGNVASFQPEGAAALSKTDRWRLKLSIFLNQLLNGKRTLTRGGIVLIMPDGHDGLSSCISLPFHGRMRDFKAGFAELALEADAPVIPVSLAVDVPKRQAAVLFLEPLDNGPADMPHPARVEGLVRQYVAFLKEEWNRCPGIVPLSQMRKHLDLPPYG